MLRAERLVLRQFFAFAMAFLLLCLGACEQNNPPSAQALEGKQLDVKAAPGKSPKGGFHHTDITGSSLKPVLNLPDRSGSAKQVADFQGKILLVFFGFTHCPDVCPSTLQEAAEAMSLMSADQAQRVQVIFVTLDPQRDQPDMLEAYVKAFHPGFGWLRGDEEQTKAAAKSFRVFFEKVTPKSGGPYTIDHTAASFVFDAQGRLRLYVKHAQGAKLLADDLAKL
ncbi:MAG: SCO family protein [Betaproteobacteria bacterium]|jgi:protein SCO1/2